MLGCAPLAGAANWVADEREEYIEEPVFQGKAYVYRAGLTHARTVVLVHGIGEKGARDWATLIPELAKHYRVLAFDLPGFARSDKANALYSPERYVAFMSHVIGRYTLGRISLVGHSLGAAVSMRYAATYPAQVEALVLADVPGILNRMSYSRYLSHLGINLLPTFYPDQREQLSAVVSNILSAVEKSGFDPQYIVNSPILRQNILQSSPAKIAGLSLVLDDHGPAIRRVEAPTLLIWGANDQLSPLRTAKVLAANMRDARLEVIEGAGHTPMDDKPDHFNRLVLAHLSQPGTAGRAYARDAGAHLAASSRTAECVKKSDRVFEGAYDTLVIRECRRVVLRQARVRELRIYDSQVEIENSYVGGTDGGMRAEDSRVSLTAVTIEAPIAVTAVASELDFAGSRLIGSELAVRAPGSSRMVFSVSQIQSPVTHGQAHGVLFVDAKNPL